MRNDAPAAIATARRLRKNMTTPERVLWTLLRRQALGFRFRRQYPVARYTLDFYCPSARLAVEVDARDAALEQLAITTLRIRDDDLIANPKAVPDRIREACQSGVAQVDRGF